MPAEWEPQEAVWFSWPTNPATWPGRLEAIRLRFAELLAICTRYQHVRLIGAGEAREPARRALEKAHADLRAIEWFDIATNDVWCRDHGPTFVLEQGRLSAVDWIYNAWGGKFPPWDLDDAVPAKVANALSIPCRRMELVCEGGALEVDGTGRLITTESVLLNANRNPGMGRTAIEDQLRDALGVGEILWLRAGMATDDTDGHVDTLTRFFAPGAVVTARCEDGQHPDAAILEDNRQLLRDGGLEVVDLPHPEPVIDPEAREERLPATYANFLVLNGAVVVPVYGQPARDQRACGVLGELFPGRTVIPLDTREILREGGSFHCLSQQQPRAINR